MRCPVCDETDFEDAQDFDAHVSACAHSLAAPFPFTHLDQKETRA